MVHSQSFRTRFIVLLILIILIFFMIWLWVSCNSDRTKGATTDPPPDVMGNAMIGMDREPRWQSYNVLFGTGADSATRNAGLYAIMEEIRDYIKDYNSTYNARFDIFYCPCDSLLFNIGITPLDGSGESASVPPPPKPPVGPGGDVLYVNNNNLMASIDSSAELSPPYQKTSLSFRSISPAVLAIMDTGLDTTFFSPDIRKLLWQPPTGREPIFNFVSNDKTNFKDNHSGKHGTAVTALTMHAMDTDIRPRLMILKALDNTKRGTTFTVSCALSYAIQNGATAINASLGYYEREGEVDSVLRHYIGLCKANSPAPIVIFAAAGNLPGPHNGGILCNAPSASTNELTESRLFYPACFSADLGNVISVTGLGTGASCFYQNFSSEYVSLGVVNASGNCCRYIIPFMGIGFEGSSYATPIACGKIMGCFMQDGAGASILNCIDENSQINTAGLSSVTKGGRFLVYTGTSGW